MFLDKILPPATIHMIGIGGISMSGLAEILKNKGYTVQGSDANDSNIIKKLRENDIKVTIGHSEENIGNASAVIFTAAIKKDNPEYIAATKKNIPLIERSVLLGEITRLFPDTIAVAGTHGKTTTTSMISTAFIECEKDPTITVGGELPLIDGNYKIGQSNFLITEACEYVESFLELSPKVSVVLNVEADHLDYYKDINHIKSSFQKFLDKLPSDGFAVLNADDKNSYELFKNTKCNVVSFGIKNMAKYSAQNIIFERDKTYYNLYIDNKFISEVVLTVPGMHNIYNSLACIAVCDIYKLDLSKVIESLKTFCGAKRRFEKKGLLNGAEIYDDYAHHPSEIKATLLAAKNRNMKKVWCVFQPHTYSRTKALLNDFANAFYNADKVIITDIYAAREKDTGEINSKDLVNEIQKTSNNAIYIKDFSDIENYLKDNLQSGDILLTIGAGNVYKIGEELIEG